MLPGVPLPEELRLTADISCVRDSDVVVLATPSFAVRSTARQLAPLVKDGTILVSVGKGIEKDTALRLSQVIAEEVGAPSSSSAARLTPKRWGARFPAPLWPPARAGWLHTWSKNYL